jgi:hypothetical protein
MKYRCMLNKNENMLRKEAGHKKSNVWFHLYEFLEWANRVKNEWSSGVRDGWLEREGGWVSGHEISFGGDKIF